MPRSVLPLMLLAALGAVGVAGCGDDRAVSDPTWSPSPHVTPPPCGTDAETSGPAVHAAMRFPEPWPKVRVSVGQVVVVREPAEGFGLPGMPMGRPRVTRGPESTCLLAGHRASDGTLVERLVAVAPGEVEMAASIRDKAFGGSHPVCGIHLRVVPGPAAR